MGHKHVEWSSLPPLYLRELGIQLLLHQPEEFNACRLVCRAWALYLAAAIRKILVWPAKLTLQQGMGPRRSQRIKPKGSYSFATLLSGITSSTEVVAMVSDISQPDIYQLQQLFNQLATCKTQHLTLVMFPQALDITVPAAINKHAKPLLQQLQATKALLHNLLTLDLSRLACQIRPNLLTPTLGHCTALRTLILGTAAQLSLPDISKVAQLTSIEKLSCMLSEAELQQQERGTQQALDTLASLPKLADLEMNLPDQKHPVNIPCWRHMSRLVEVAMLPAVGDARLLPEQLCISIQMLQVAALQLPSSCCEVLELQSLWLTPGMQLGQAQLPGVTHIAVLGNMPLDELTHVVQQLSKLQALDLSQHGMELMPDNSGDGAEGGLLQVLMAGDEEGYVEYCTGLAALLQGLQGPQLAGITRLCTSRQLQDDLLWDPQDNGGEPDPRQLVLQGIQRLQGLRQLELQGLRCAQDLSPLRGLPALQELTAWLDNLNMMHLPASLTKLVVMGITGLVEGLPGVQQQQNQQHQYPALRHLTLVFEEDEQWGFDILQQRMQFLSLLGSILPSLQDLGVLTKLPYHLKAMPAAIAPPSNGEVVSTLTALHSLHVPEPWDDMQQHLAPLKKLQSLSFARYGLPESALRAVVDGVAGLAGGCLRELVVHPEGSWPAALVARLQQELPGCMLHAPQLRLQIEV